ncbi:unnamed protein product [Peniophora sp. CBMAI 1063]|nr:unnamed protein product [Peniophora sp. CBMAI 1063]
MANDITIDDEDVSETGTPDGHAPSSLSPASLGGEDTGKNLAGQVKTRQDRRASTHQPHGHGAVHQMVEHAAEEIDGPAAVQGQNSSLWDWIKSLVEPYASLRSQSPRFVCLTSSDPVNQTVARGSLTQMINHVFARCAVSTTLTSNNTSTTPPAATSPDASGSSSPPMPAQVLEQPQARMNGDARDNGDHALDTPVGENAPLAPSSIPATNGHALPPTSNGDAHPHHPPLSEDGEGEGEREGMHELTTNDLFLKDAFLVCRAMCKC